MADHFIYDVFLSYSSQDKPRVRKLAERLKQAKLRVWFDEWIIKPGDDIYLAIERGLETARVQVLCLSPQALGSAWVTLERNTVLFRDPTNAGRRFVPLLLADCNLPDTLRRYKYVDFRQETPTAFDELLAACRGEMEAPPPAPQTVPKKKPAKPKPAKPPEQAEPLAKLERKLTGHTNWVRSVAVSPDGKWAASSSDDKTVKIWELETGKCRATLEGHTREIWSVAITPDGKRILSGSNDNTIRVWDVFKLKHQDTLSLGGLVLSVSPLEDNERLLIGLSSSKSRLELWSLSGRRRVWGQNDPSGYAQCVAVDREAKLAISGHGPKESTEIRLWNLETGECLATLKGHSGKVNSVQITPDGRFAVSGSEDKTVKVWDLEAAT